jgi:type I restriction enzyme M protein
VTQLPKVWKLSESSSLRFVAHPFSGYDEMAYTCPQKTKFLLTDMTDNQELERTLWAAADKLRSNMDAAEYKHVVLGLIFLKYISDAFDAKHQWLKDHAAEGYDPEDRDEYLAEKVFWVPTEARWTSIQQRAKQPDIGSIIDGAMDVIERDNASLKGVLPKDYARPDLDKTKLGELVDLISNIGFNQPGHSAKDLLGRVYEYFLGQFADAEGKKGGQFYTPASIVRLLVQMLEPYSGRVYDGCCGSGGMFVQSEKFITEHHGKIDDISVYGQESNPTTLRLCKMNLAIRGIEANIQLGDTFQQDRHPALKADYILANPPFNISDWGGEHLRNDERWQFGTPPTGNANYAWLQHFIYHLAPTGTAGIVLANGSMTSNSGGEGDIRRNLIEAGLVDCMVALPSQLFYNTMIPACLWFLARDRSGNSPSFGGGRGEAFRDRSGEILFIDARTMGTMISRRNRDLTEADLAKIAGAYHNWRNVPSVGVARLRNFESFVNVAPEYQNIKGFCHAATLDEVRANNYVLTPGRYVGAEDIEDDGIPFDEKMNALTGRLAAQFAESARLELLIRDKLKEVGYEF